jgi:glycerol kinase
MNTIDEFGQTDVEIFGSSIPIKAIAGDQHSALIGQACFNKGDIKSTYGTGCFALQNIGEEIKYSSAGLLTTLAYQLDGKPTYAIEGSIFIAGAGVQWLRDEVGLIKEANECDELASASNLDDPVCLVPAFTGLGAPYWQADVRGALLNLTRGTGRKEITRATLEAVGFQTKDLFMAMAEEQNKPGNGTSSLPKSLKVDGGLTNSNWTMQFLADILDCTIETSITSEATALGVAYLAGHSVGLYEDFKSFSQKWQCSKQFKPLKDNGWRKEKLQIWNRAITTLTGTS